MKKLTQEEAGTLRKLIISQVRSHERNAKGTKNMDFCTRETFKAARLNTVLEKLELEVICVDCGKELDTNNAEGVRCLTCQVNHNSRYEQ